MSTNWPPRLMSGERCNCKTLHFKFSQYFCLPRFNVDCVDWITEAEKETLKEKLKSIVTKDGWILVKSDKTRSQSLNQKDAIEKMNNLVNEALKPPEPKFSEEELLRMKRGKAKANKERLKDKKFRGDTKRDRRGPPL